MEPPRMLFSHKLVTLANATIAPHKLTSLQSFRFDRVMQDTRKTKSTNNNRVEL